MNKEAKVNKKHTAKEIIVSVKIDIEKTSNSQYSMNNITPNIKERQTIREKIIALVSVKNLIIIPFY